MPNHFAVQQPPTFEVIVHADPEGGYWVEAPGIPGLVSQGETKEELTVNLKEAFEGWLLEADPETAARLGIQPTPSKMLTLELVENEPITLIYGTDGQLRNAA